MMRIFLLVVLAATALAVDAIATHETQDVTTTTTSADHTPSQQQQPVSLHQPERPEDADHDGDDHIMMQMHHRRLIANLFCPNDLLPLISCVCKNTLLPPVFSSQCTLKDNDGIVCAPVIGIVCAVPSVKTSFDLFRLFRLALPIGVEVCYEDLSIFNITTPIFGGLCIDFFDPIGSLLDFFTLGLLPKSSSGRAGDAPKTVYKACQAKMDGKECETCQVCDDGRGGTSVTLKCGGLELSSCTTLLAAPLPKSVSEAPDLTKAVPFVMKKSA
jgi:hypothetical protein